MRHGRVFKYLTLQHFTIILNNSWTPLNGSEHVYVIYDICTQDAEKNVTSSKKTLKRTKNQKKITAFIKDIRK